MTITPATHAISINPATGEQLSVLPWAGVDDIENALQLAAAGFRDWRETNIDYRAEKLRDIGKALRARSEACCLSWPARLFWYPVPVM